MQREQVALGEPSVAVLTPDRLSSAVSLGLFGGASGSVGGAHDRTRRSIPIDPTVESQVDRRGPPNGERTASREGFY
jgi:hypothetical protein